MGSQSIAHEAELVGQKNIDKKHLLLVQARLILFCRQNITNMRALFATSGL